MTSRSTRSGFPVAISSSAEAPSPRRQDVIAARGEQGLQQAHVLRDVVDDEDPGGPVMRQPSPPWQCCPTIARRPSTSTGFARYPSKPAAMNRSRSPRIAWAVRASTGIVGGAFVRPQPGQELRRRPCQAAGYPSTRGPGRCSDRQGQPPAPRSIASSVRKPVAWRTSRNSFMFFSLSSTTRTAACHDMTGRAGRVNVNVLPRPGSLSSQIRPPCSSTSRLDSAKPRPVPSMLP